MCGGTGLSGHEFLSNKENSAGGVAKRNCAVPRRQHGIRNVSRTALVTMPIMLTAFALLHLKRQTNVIIFCAAIVLAALAWTTSPQLQWTTTTFLRDYQIYKELNQPTSVGMRLGFWQKSLRFFAEAPIIGHGTGSTRGLFEQAATGPKVLAGGQVVSNPHNQTLNVAIQWGVIGVILL